jgi:transcriptional regulator with XRE-family HTH domain
MLMRFSVVPFWKQKKVKEKSYAKLLVAGATNFRLLSELRFKIPYKQARFLHWQELVPNTNVDVVPNIGLELKQLFELLNMPYRNRAVSNIERCIGGRDNLSRESVFHLCTEFENRIVQIEQISAEIASFFDSLPVGSEADAQQALRAHYSGGDTFASIASRNGVSPTVVRRVVRGITAPTNNTIALAARLPHAEKFARMDEVIVQKPCFKLKQWCEELGFELRYLCRESDCRSNALYGYVTGHGTPPYSVVYRLTQNLHQQAGRLLSDSVAASKAVAKLKQLAGGTLFFDPIVQIETVKPAYDFVYDLSTENRNFVANKIVVHNSVAVKSLIEEVLARPKESGRIAVIVMDAHGEYTNFAEAAPKTGKNYSHQTLVVNAPDIRIGVPKLNVNLISSIVSGLSNPQKRVLQRILRNLQEEMRSGMGPFDFVTVKKAVSNDSEIKGETQAILQSWIGILEDLRLFAKTDLPSVSDLVKPGQLTVVDLSGIIDQRKKQIIVSHFSNILFNERQKGKVPPFLLVVEEAHNFAPERAKEEHSLSKRIIETISREGRKFGASLCLVSQRPINLSTTALANCNTHLILRVTNPYDLKHIGESSEGIDHDSERMITSLRVGEALLVGEAVNFPVFFKVRKNYSADSRHEKTLEQAAREFEEKKSLIEKEAEEFL